MDGPVIEHGAVVLSSGRINSVGRADEICAEHAGAEPVDLGRVVLLPGLANAHAHLELSSCAPAASYNGRFVDWILGIRDRIRLDPENLHASISESIRTGVEQCLRFGVTSVGDISQQMHLTRPLLTGGPLRVVSFGEALGLARRRPRFDELFARAIDTSAASEFLRIGISPHAPYTVDLDGFRQCLAAARERHLPLATHLAETTDEEPFLRDHAGPFAHLWQRLGFWEEPVPTYRGSPIEFAGAIGLLDYPSLLAHVNHCRDEELDLLARGRASVVYCPRTHRYFGHPPHRWREMLAAGINVAVGTDSCASSPDLNLVDDLRLLRALAPAVPAAVLWEMATVRGARALGTEQEVGSLAPGKFADMVAFPVVSDDPLEEVLRSDVLPIGVWIGGVRRGD